jgi:hypothetical protein
VWVFSQVAHADEAACFADAESGQALARRGSLIEARAALARCAADACPAEVASDCHQWLGQLEERLPSIVLGARERDGADLTGVRFSIDDVPVEPDGKAVPVNPGPHRIRAARGAAVREASIVTREGEKGRLVVLTFPREDTRVDWRTLPEPSPAPVPVAAWISGGVGAVALGTFAIVGGVGAANFQHLSDTCRPHCTTDQVRPVDAEFIVADVALAVAALAAGLTTVLVLHRADGSAQAHATSRVRAALP